MRSSRMFYVAQFVTGPLTPERAAVLCECLASLNQIGLAEHPELKSVPLAQLGLQYANEDRSLADQYLEVEVLVRSQYGDCTEFSALRVAQLRCSGVPARVIIVDGGKDLHAIVEKIVRVGGPSELEDPSIPLGMKPYPWPPKVLYALDKWF